MLQLSSRLARLALAPPSLLARPPAASLHLGPPLLFQMTGEDEDLGQWAVALHRVCRCEVLRPRQEEEETGSRRIEGEGRETPKEIGEGS